MNSNNYNNNNNNNNNNNYNNNYDGLILYSIGILLFLFFMIISLPAMIIAIILIIPFTYIKINKIFLCILSFVIAVLINLKINFR